MKKRIRAVWITRKEREIWCCDFGGFGGDRAGLVTEIEASQAVINQQVEDSLLVAVDLCQAKMTPEIAAFFKKYSDQTKNPIHKMAIVGVSTFQKLRYQWLDNISWPKNSRFFSDWEKAKDWLIEEGF
jgi:hypothetical protein